MSAPRRVFPKPQLQGFIGEGDLTQPEPKAALAYWQDKRGDAPMPRPRDIDPTEIAKILAHVTIIEILHETPIDFLYRIDGEVVSRAVGFRRMGKRLSKIRESYGTGYESTIELFTLIVEGRAPRFIRAPLKRFQRAFYSLETALLPLSQDGVRVDRIFSCSGIVRQPEDA